MKRLLRSEKGLTFIEVLIALAVLGLLSVPIMMMFMNAQIYARKVDKQTEISAVTRTVKQLVSEGLEKDGPLWDTDGKPVDIDGEEIDSGDTFQTIIKHANKLNSTITTPHLQIKGTEIIENYTYTVKYDPEKYYDPNFKGVYTVLITIIDRESNNVVNEIKVSVNVENEITDEKVESEED